MSSQTPIAASPGAEPYAPALAAQLADALSKKGKEYEPRTHHLLPGGAPKFTNRLIKETSPYLLQHAHNPVGWYAWGEEAFEAAHRLGRPIFLSIGYSTCHWCHVMEAESFEDVEIATYLNSHFIPIKVDREERPDVDSVYMTAVQLMTGGGGWPMTVVMTPDRRPFFGGTYFPARDGDRGTRVGFLTILQRLTEAYTNDREQVVAAAQRLTQAVAMHNQRDIPDNLPGPDAMVLAAKRLAERFDPRYGGFGQAPKFPRPSTFELMLHYWRRTQDASALYVVTHSVDRMMNGGIYDHVAGGFARYSTDAQWLVPHFEKMLYDNAQLLSLLVDTWQSTGDDSFAEVAKETADYVLKEMTSPSGGFYSATDADSEGHEGLFFVWTPAQLRGALGEPRSRIVEAVFGVTERGNFEGKNILNRARPDDVVARELGIEVSALRKEVAAAKEILYALREERVHPLLDDKILTEWNGQMIGALARTGWALKEPKYVKAAERAANFVLESLTKDGRLLRSHRAGESKHMAVLEDYAFFISGLLDLFEATGTPRWAREAIRLEGVLEKHYADAAGGFFATADDAEVLLIREKPIYDGAQPAGASVAAMNLLRLSELTTEEHYRARALATLRTFGEALGNGALECPKAALALDFALDRPKEIALVVTDADDGATLEDVVRTTYLPNRVFVRVKEAEVAELAKTVPWLEGKKAMGGRATAYVCLAQTCKRPTSSPQELKEDLAEVEKIEAPLLSVR